MASNPKGFMSIKREASTYRPVCERVKDYAEVNKWRPADKTKEQTTRCMDCGTPFCNWGCPVGNYIPEWNDLTSRGQWQKAFELLNATNNLPEVTGRVCPNPCEFACVLGINDDPITIRENERDIIEYAFKHDLVKPKVPKKRTGKKVAVVGSGPAGLSAAAQLNQAGHKVTVFEREQKLGGLMRYGIPDFKLEKKILDRRIKVWQKEGVVFKAGVNVGVDLPIKKLLAEFDAVLLAGGSKVPRDLKVPGRELQGIHFAMDYLSQSNKRVAKEKFSEPAITAQGKKVVVIGGGDTGSDCVGTANRQGAACVVQIEVMPQPPECRDNKCPWPTYPMLLKTTSSHEEGAQRQWSILTKKFTGNGEQVTGLKCVKVEFNGGKMSEIAGSEFDIEADLVLLAVGFLNPEPIKGLAIELDQRGNFQTDQNYQTSLKKVFAAGDAHRGQSLIVWAIKEGRSAAAAIDLFLNS